MRRYYWAEDSYWTDALEEFYEMRRQGATEITLDLEKIVKIAALGDGPAYKLMEAMESVQREERWDGHKGASRVMLALLVRLKGASEAGEAEAV